MLSVTALMFILGTVAFALSVCLSQQQLPQLLNLVEFEWSLRSLDVVADIFAVITRLNVSSSNECIIVHQTQRNSL
ncbi:hypothetical protein BC834DRAFT_851944 [Gloeopeniophorella convolvens]|nr:hypothetical protein BC834DRAFT_851944 [Gloeopeniophorella convolvens]